MSTYTKDEIRDLIDGRLPWEMVKRIMSSPKDTDRFDKYLAVLQERVTWPDRILLPLGEHLYIVDKPGERVVKCDCGHEFGDYRENWKLHASIYVRDSEEKLEELYPGPRKPDPAICEIREFYCPGCGTQLEVESAPPGYPITFNFLPDIDAFYRDWLNRPLATAQQFIDLSYDRTKTWAVT